MKVFFLKKKKDFWSVCFGQTSWVGGRGIQINFLEVVGDLGSGRSSTHSTGDQTARLLLVCVWKDGGSSLSSPGYPCLVSATPA